MVLVRTLTARDGGLIEKRRRQAVVRVSVSPVDARRGDVASAPARALFAAVSRSAHPLPVALCAAVEADDVVATGLSAAGAAAAVAVAA